MYIAGANLINNRGYVIYNEGKGDLHIVDTSIFGSGINTIYMKGGKVTASGLSIARQPYGLRHKIGQRRYRFNKLRHRQRQAPVFTPAKGI